MNDVKITEPNVLPSFFYTCEGELDLGLFEELWKQTGLSIGRIKTLVRMGSGTNDDSAKIKAFAEHCEKSEWRRSWYLDCVARKKGVPRHICHLALALARKYDSRLDISTPKLSTFFKKSIDGRIYPLLKKVPELARELKALFEEQPKAVSMFIWGLCERANWAAKIKGQASIELKKFSSALLTELLSENNASLSSMLLPSETRKIIDGRISGSAGKVNEVPPIQPIRQTPSFSFIENFRDEALNNVKLKLLTDGRQVRKEVEFIQKALLAISKDYQSIDLLETAALKAKAKLEDLDKILGVGRLVVDGATEVMSNRLERLQFLNIPAPRHWIVLPSMLNPKPWDMLIEEQFKLLDELICLDQCFTEYSKAASHAYQERFAQCYGLDLATAITELKQIHREVNSAHLRLVKWNNALLYIASVASDPGWDAITDPGMSDHWESLAVHSIDQDPEGDLTWLICRQAIGESSVVSQDIAARLGATTADSWLNNTRKLSFLEPSQLEQIALSFPELEFEAVLTQLFGFIAAAHVGDPQKFDYWSSWPLRQYAKDPGDVGNPPLDRFASTIFTFSTEDDGAGVLAELREIAHDVGVDGDGEAGDSEELARLELDSLLTYRVHGEGNYAALWKTAYRDCIEPLKNLAPSLSSRETAEKLLRALAEIDVDARYLHWIRALQHSMYSESHYEAATKVYVAGRLAKIKNWCDRFAVCDVERSNIAHPIRDALETIGYHTEKTKLQLWVGWVAQVLKLDKMSVPSLRSEEQILRYGIGLVPDISSPRSYISYLGGVNPTWQMLCTDYLSKIASCTKPSDLLSFYRQVGSLEAQEHVLERYPDTFTDMEVKRLVQDVHLYSIKLAVRISDLKSQLHQHGVQAEGLTQIRDMELAFEGRNWTLCRNYVDYGEAWVSKLEKDKQDADDRANLTQHIGLFGGEAFNWESRQELVDKLEALIQASASRRIHIKVLADFAATRNLSNNLVEISKHSVEKLSLPSMLPTESESQFLAEIFESALVPIATQLKRPQVLQHSYKNLLELLASTVVSGMVSIIEDVSGNQTLLAALIDCAAMVEEAGSATELKELIRKFAGESGMTSLVEEIEQVEIHSHGLLSPIADEASVQRQIPDIGLLDNDDSVDYVATVYSWLRRHASSLEGETSSYNLHMERREWSDGLKSSLNIFSNPTSLQLSDASPDRDALLAGAICALNMPHALADYESSYAIGLIARCPDAGPVQWAYSQKGRLGQSILVDSLGMVILRWANKDVAASDHGKLDLRGQVGSAIRELSNLQIAGDVPRQEAKAIFGDSSSVIGLPPGFMLKLLWDGFTGDKQQAEIRAGLMLLLYKAGLYKYVGLCFTLAPIEIEKRVALAYAHLLENSETAQGRESLENIRGGSQSKPFMIFTQSVLASLTRSSGLPAEITFATPLEKTSERKTWEGILTITPRAINPPLDIELELPGDGAILFGTGRRKMKFNGPFFDIREERVELIINSPDFRSTMIRVRCDFITLEEQRIVSEIELTLTADAAEPFSPLSTDQLSKAFSDFPQFQMRGVEYVPRDADEKRIEKALFDGERAGSIWISSPRRSGKTTMLFRILDSYSHKVGRDNAIIFLSMDKGFKSAKDFNQWVWSRVNFNGENVELRSKLSEFSRIGEKLPFESGADIFLAALSKEIIARSNGLTRVYFLIDEIDKLAEMMLSGGVAKDTAVELSWQFRHIISSQSEIGMVFSGSNPARTMFVRNPQAALFNSIMNFDLIPFGVANDLERRRSREVVEPASLRGRYKLPDKTLEFLIKVTSGIPYYMKLVAGATYAVSQQKYLMHSDVIHGLTSLLNKTTGVTALDSLDDPGEDELRVLYTRNERDQLLVRAVLYSAADIRSPISGGPLMNGELRSPRSPLVSRYSLSKADINSGVDSAVQLGYLKRHRELAALEFTIPMLGESIRHRSGALWAIINDKLEQLISI